VPTERVKASSFANQPTASVPNDSYRSSRQHRPGPTDGRGPFDLPSVGRPTKGGQKSTDLVRWPMSVSTRCWPPASQSTAECTPGTDQIDLRQLGTHRSSAPCHSHQNDRDHQSGTVRIAGSRFTLLRDTQDQPRVGPRTHCASHLLREDDPDSIRKCRPIQNRTRAIDPAILAQTGTLRSSE
jgi:hypothetical protein